MANIAERNENLVGETISYLPRVIASMGQEQFGNALLDLLGVACGARHFALSRMATQSPAPILAVSHDGTDTAHRQISRYWSESYWRSDSFMHETMRAMEPDGFSLGHIFAAQMPEKDLYDKLYRVTNAGERFLLCGRFDGGALGLSILRSEDQGYATSEELFCLRQLSATLIAILNRHVTMRSEYPDASHALTSLREIEETLQDSAVLLPRREIEVCSRILYGISKAGIALDLGISEETVTTYRKRAYQRLSIGTQRELLVWYLREWSRMHRRSQIDVLAAGTPPQLVH